MAADPSSWALREERLPFRVPERFDEWYTATDKNHSTYNSTKVWYDLNDLIIAYLPIGVLAAPTMTTFPLLIFKSD